jgi:predicted Fe-Mo cluster-binding NifX family protein
MKIALPSRDSNVDQHFGNCQCFTILGIDDRKNIVSEEVLTPPPGCGCKSNIVPQLARMGVSVMLAGNMGGGAVNVLASHGIQVVRGCAGNIREVAQAWLAGRVDDSGASCQSHHEGACHDHS